MGLRVRRKVATPVSWLPPMLNEYKPEMLPKSGGTVPAQQCFMGPWAGAEPQSTILVALLLQNM